MRSPFGFSLFVTFMASVVSFAGSAAAIGSSPCDRVSEGILPGEKDLNKLTPEALLVSYLRINTTNPPGCEGKAARFWKAFFDRYGVESQVIPLPFGQDRANLLARVRGKKTGLRPLLLLNHMDVVPAEASRWMVPPFEGVIRGGIIFGRGTFDMKATGVYQALMLAKAQVQKWDLHRDLIFLGTSNEEGPFDRDKGIISGAEWMLEHRINDLGNPEFVITEGGYIPTDKGQAICWEVSPGEKARLELTFSVDDRVPSLSEKRLIMARSAQKIMTGFKAKSLPQTVSQHNDSLADPVLRASLSTTHALTVFGGVGKGNTIPSESLAQVAITGATQPAPAMKTLIQAVLPNGVVIESLSMERQNILLKLRSKGVAGHASLPPRDGGVNVALAQAVMAIEGAIQRKQIPARGLEVSQLAAVSDEDGKELPVFVVDFRLLPGDSRDEVLNQIKTLLKDLPVTFSITDDAVISNASPTGTALFAAITEANKKFHPNPKSRPPVKSPILNSTTDAAYFRQRGMIVYGFEPIMLDPDQEHSHGDNEQISVPALRFATDVTEFYLKRFLSQSQGSQGSQSIGR